SRSTSRPRAATSAGAAADCSSSAVRPHAFPAGLRRRRVVFFFFSAMASDEIAGRDQRNALQRAAIEIYPAAARRSIRASDRDLRAAERLVFISVEHAEGGLRLAQPINFAAHPVGIARRGDGAGERAEIVEPSAKRSIAD